MVNREPAALQETERRVKELIELLQKSKDSYAILPSGANERALYTQFDITLKTYLSEQARALELSQQGQTEAVRQLVNGQMKDLADLMGVQLSKLIAINKVNASDASDLAGEQYSNAKLAIIIVSVAATLLTVLLAWLLTRSIVTPLSEAVSAAQDIAEGKLTGHIEVGGSDEPARLLGALSIMQQNLRTTIAMISGSATQLASSAEELSAVTEESSRG